MAKHKYNYAKTKLVPTESVCISQSYLKQTRIFPLQLLRDSGMSEKA